MRCFSLPLCLIGCLALSWGSVFRGVAVEVICVCWVYQNDAFVGWFAFFLESGRFLLVSVCASVRQVSLFLSCAHSTVQTPPPPAS